MLSRAIRPVRTLLYFSLLIFNFSLLSVFAQDDPPETAAPPLRTMTKDEKALLIGITDLKIHTKLSLDLMNGRLVQAEKLNLATDFDNMFRELGGFHGLLENTLEFLEKQDQNNGKVLDNYKRFEIALRSFAPRLETIRRDLPIRYEDYVRKLIYYVRDARAKAVEPMFGDSVVPTKKPDPLF